MYAYIHVSWQSAGDDQNDIVYAVELSEAVDAHLHRALQRANMRQTN